MADSFRPPWTVAHKVPLSMGFSRQEYWSRLPFSTPGDLPDPGIKPTSPMYPALAGIFFPTVPPGKPWPQIVSQDLIQMHRVRNIVMSNFIESSQNHYYNHPSFNDENEIWRGAVICIIISVLQVKNLRAMTWPRQLSSLKREDRFEFYLQIWN